MSIKLTILLLLGAIVLALLVRMGIRAWRYRCNHPDEIYEPSNRNIKNEINNE